MEKEFANDSENSANDNNENCESMDEESDYRIKNITPNQNINLKPEQRMWTRAGKRQRGISLI